VANRNFANGGKTYAPHVKPVLLDCNFIVDSTNANGLGIRSLKGPLVQNVFMNTTVAAGLGNTNPNSPNVAVRNPNPAPGAIVVQFQDNYHHYLGSFSSVATAASSTPLTSTTAGTAYIITSLGSATEAQWQARGLPNGITPALGVSFVATATGLIGGAAAIQTTASVGSGFMTVESIGNPDVSLSPNPRFSQGFGGQMILQTRGSPADGTVISLSFYLNDSAVTVKGDHSHG